MEVGTSQIFDLVGEVQALGDKTIEFDFSSSVLTVRELSDAACIDVKTHDRLPARANVVATGRPTYPNPVTEMRLVIRLQ